MQQKSSKTSISIVVSGGYQLLTQKCGPLIDPETPKCLFDERPHSPHAYDHTSKCAQLFAWFLMCRHPILIYELPTFFFVVCVCVHVHLL